jgi:hypothetical protein
MGRYNDIVKGRLPALASGGMLSGDQQGIGKDGNEFRDFFERIKRYAPRDDIDTLYVFADFYWDWDGTGRGWESCLSSDSGTESAVDQLRSTQWRVYFETVKCDPPPALIHLAEASGGGIIRTFQ